MPPKITINGKEVDLTNLPPEWRDLSKLPPGFRDLLEDKNNDGMPDIADNPFAAMAKLGKLAHMAKDMPVLLSQMKTTVQKTGSSVPGASSSPDETTPPALSFTPATVSAPQKKPSAQSWMTSSPPVKKDTGRKVLFWMVIIGVLGWYAWSEGWLAFLAEL